MKKFKPTTTKSLPWDSGLDLPCFFLLVLTQVAMGNVYWTKPTHVSNWCLLHVPHWFLTGLYFSPPNIVRQVYTGYSISVFTLQTKILVLGLITWVGLEINNCNDHGLGFTQLSSAFGGLVWDVLTLLSCCSLVQSMWTCPTASFPLAGEDTSLSYW